MSCSLFVPFSFYWCLFFLWLHGGCVTFNDIGYFDFRDKFEILSVSHSLCFFESPFLSNFREELWQNIFELAICKIKKYVGDMCVRYSNFMLRRFCPQCCLLSSYSTCIECTTSKMEFNWIRAVWRWLLQWRSPLYFIWERSCNTPSSLQTKLS